MALYLILRHSQQHPVHTIGGAVGEWFYNIVLYQILLSIVLGAAIGFIARKTLKYAEKNGHIDHDNFLAYGTEDTAFQDVIDTLLNTAIFLYIGSVLPWNQFGNFWGITPWRLVVLGILVMLVRRVPWVIAMAKLIPALPTFFEAAFAGFFGPIGVGAVFYVQVAFEYLPEDRERLINVIEPVVYFLVLTSVIVHGITIPLGKVFTVVHRTLTVSKSQAGEQNAVSRLPPAPTTLPVSMTAEEAQMAEAKDNGSCSSSTDKPAPRNPDEVAVRFGAPGPTAVQESPTDQRSRMSTPVPIFINSRATSLEPGQ